MGVMVTHKNLTRISNNFNRKVQSLRDELNAQGANLQVDSTETRTQSYCGQTGQSIFAADLVDGKTNEWMACAQGNDQEEVLLRLRAAYWTKYWLKAEQLATK